MQNFISIFHITCIVKSLTSECEFSLSGTSLFSSNQNALFYNHNLFRYLICIHKILSTSSSPLPHFRLHVFTFPLYCDAFFVRLLNTFAICSVFQYVLAGIKSSRLFVHLHILSLSVVDLYFYFFFIRIITSFVRLG